MHYRNVLKFLPFTGLLFLVACGPGTPWVANGYSEPVTVSTTLPDKEMDEDFIALKPGECVEGAGQHVPAFSKIAVAHGNQVTNSYSQQDIAKALNGANPDSGVFVVAPSGLSFSGSFNCASAKTPFLGNNCAGGWPCSTGAH